MPQGMTTRHLLFLGGSLALWGVVGWFDYRLGMKVRFGPFYALPVLLLSWYLGRAWGVFAALVSGALWHTIQLLVIPETSFKYFRYWDLALGFLAFAAIAIGAAWAKELSEKEANAKRELQQALDRVRVLEGMLPICAWCQKVRDDQGAWEPIETYVGKHSNTTWTHGICPECERKFKEHGFA